MDFTDSELLQQYISQRSETAFACLVERHIDLVYSSALRQLGGNVEWAEDAAQIVFVDLARKAESLTNRSSLSGWLYTSARFAAVNLLRVEQRRRVREQEVDPMHVNQANRDDTPSWDQLRPVLDQAMEQLAEPDREALLLRFFQSRDLKEVGNALGISDDAARKRVDRALERLGSALRERGITSTTTALSAGLAGAALVAAPDGLAASVAGAAITSSIATAASTSLIGVIGLKLGIAAAVAVGVGSLLFFVKPNAAAKRFQLPSGAHISFLGADFGKTHGYPPNAPLVKAMRKILPPRWSSLLGPSGGWAIGQDSIFFWYRQETNGPQPDLVRVLVDDQGVESAVINYGCSQNFPDGAKLEGCGATVWPRRSVRVGLRFYQVAGTNPPVRVGEFWTANPHRVDASQWAPAPLPIRASASDLEVNLVGVEFGQLPAAGPLSRPEAPSAWPYLRFQLTWKGKPTRSWQIQRSTLEDASGNKLDLWEPSFNVAGDEILPLRGHFRDGSRVSLLPCSLWPGEKSWKFQVTFSPRADAQFAPEDLCSFRDIAVPDEGEEVQLDLTSSVSAGRVTLVSLFGKGADPSGKDHQFTDTEVLTVSPMTSPNVASILVKAIDQAGSIIPSGPAQPFSVQTGPRTWNTYSGIPLTIPASSRTLDITFGVTTNRAVEFLAPAPKFPARANSVD